MSRFFIVANSFAAPFVSDESTHFVEAVNAGVALEVLARTYRHPAGLYSATCYADANAYHEGAKPLAQWLCNHEQKKQAVTKDKGSYTYEGLGPGDFKIDGDRYTTPNPKQGSVVEAGA